KTYAVVRAELAVHRGLPRNLRHGGFSAPRAYPAWVRFSGPGPSAPPDIRDNGVLSIGGKLMDVPGPKLLDYEHSTQDLRALSAPMFTPPAVGANVALQRHLMAGIPILYFLNPADPHLLHATMQALDAKVHAHRLRAAC